MVYTAWLCCIILSILENLCGCLRFCISAMCCAHCCLCQKKREKHLLKVLRPCKAVSLFSPQRVQTGLLFFPRVFFHRPRLPLTTVDDHSLFQCFSFLACNKSWKTMRVQPLASGITGRSRCVVGSPCSSALAFSAICIRKCCGSLCQP